MSVSAVSSVNKPNQIFPSANPPAGHLKESALRITEFVKDKIFRAIYYIPLIGRITQNYFEEQEAKNNYDNKLHRARSFYDRLIECIEKSDAQRATICAELVKTCGEEFAKIAAAMPKNDKKFAEKVDLDVEGVRALVAAAQEALDKMKKEK